MAVVLLLIWYYIGMRLAFLIFLLITVATGSGYAYLTTMALCVTPLHYRIGTFDERFSISETSAKAALVEAESVWEDLTERDLFVYDEEAKFVVNFIYDDRQAVVLDQHDTEARLNTVEEQNQKIRDEFKVLENVFIADKERYEEAVATYNQAFADLNERIDRYNSSSNPSEEEEDNLRQEQARLEQDARALDEEVKRLNTISDELNDLAQRGNVMVEVYNQGVQSYNNRFGEAHEFTQGDYQGGEINIYTFLDEAELVRVLVHEFGHGLGIGHVENDASMMYHIMSNQPAVASLSREDEEAFFMTCGEDTDLKNRLVTPIVRYFKL